MKQDQAPPLPFRPDWTIKDFLKKHSSLSAVTVISFWQISKLVIIFSVCLIFFFYDYKLFWVTVLFVLCIFYTSAICYRFFLVLLSLVRNPEIKISEEELSLLTTAELPVYTVLLPMYKEAEVAEKLLRAINHLDYPQEKLDIKLLLEEDDTLTVDLCKKLELPVCCEIIICPNSFPKTKPKACNHGLAAARGEYLVIYDAEDHPAPDQLKKAVVGFGKVAADVACLQSKLNYYNPFENWLTKWFTLEYTAWFDLFLPGLHALDAPIPLGGTSNHFRTCVLQQLGGWDPFNVTEDCDLGIRIHRKKYRTQVLDSTTWEEANKELGNWIRQRSRWVKGYFQTHLVHTRNSCKTLLELGPFGFFSFFMTVGGLSAMLILNPVFWITCLVYLALVAGEFLGLSLHPWQMIYTDRISDINLSYTWWSKLSWVFFSLSVTLLLANVIFVLINVLACFKRGLRRLIPMALLTPFYWILISIAAWKGFLQLFFRPFYWEKTQHGLTRTGKNKREKNAGEKR